MELEQEHEMYGYFIELDIEEANLENRRNIYFRKRERFQIKIPPPLLSPLHNSSSWERIQKFNHYLDTISENYSENLNKDEEMKTSHTHLSSSSIYLYKTMAVVMFIISIKIIFL
jgi:hypothetical protein